MPNRSKTLRHGALGAGCVHLCVDMQRMFAEDTAWKTPWMDRVLPNVLRLVAAHPAQTVFTRFIPAERPGQGVGTWRRYYRRWADMTLQHLGRSMVELMPELTAYVPPAAVIDKRVYSPWHEPALRQLLQRRGADALVISGGETDVCVLSTVLGAIDHGYRVVIAEDALCSSSDETHDALITVYEQRYTQQVETVPVAEILAQWP
ncbi:MAG: cysteine hydrolase [Burkholderiales bacterium]|nr:cysteine hydrolase [Burkholderiales bacterium]